MTLTADLLVPFSEAASVSLKDASALLRKRIVVSMVFSDPHVLHQMLFEDEHIDWQGVQHYLSEVSGTSTADWMHMVSLMDFVNEPTVQKSYVTDMIASALAGIKVITQVSMPIHS